MSGRRWIFTLLAAVPFSAFGCQVDGGATKMWKPFANAKTSDVADDEQLPKFVRRAADEEEKKLIEAPIDEGRVKALHAEGQRALQENRMSEARQAYSEVLQLVPDDPTAHHGLAMAADLTEQWADAETHYRHALRTRPRDANLLCDIGYSYLLQNRYSEASSYLSQAIHINPNHENAHANLALLDLRQGNREAARERLLQHYENPETVTQILTALESQIAPKTSSGLAEAATSIPENASFEEIRELANRERIAAEQRRAALNIPDDHHAAIDSVSPASHTNLRSQYETADVPGDGRHPSRFRESNIDPGMAVTPSVAGSLSGNTAQGNYAPDSGAAIPSHTPPQPGSISGMNSHAGPLVADRHVNPASSITGSVAGSLSQSSMLPQNPTLSQYPIGSLQYPANPGQANFSSQPSISVNDTFSRTANTSPGSGGLISVRPSGAFQPPDPSVSYGKPFGFGERPVESASFKDMSNLVTHGAPASYGTASYGHTNGQFPGKVAGQWNPDPSQQFSNSGQNSAHVQIEGLNAGPGSLFPVGQGAGHPDGSLRTENLSPPGSNAVINDAMFGQPVSTLPAQEWMMQQQQKIQQLNSQQQPPNESGQKYFDQGYRSPPDFGNTSTGAKLGMPTENPATNGTTVAPRTGNPAPPFNSLESYENQLRQLDNQYNNTLQQLDPDASATMPRARY